MTGKTPHTSATPSRPAKKLFKSWGVCLLAVLFVCVVFVVGNLSASFGLLDVGKLTGLRTLQTQGASTLDEATPATQLSARLSEVADMLDARALYRYTQGDLDAATTTAIGALIEASDDTYAQYFTPEEYEAYLRGSEGKYSGVGIVLTDMSGELTVLQVYEDSPAFDAGIMTGDVLLSIDGDAHDWELSEAIEAIRRPVGEEVSLTWRRGEEERETPLVLRDVNVPTIISHLIEQDGQAVGYAYLRRFNAQSAHELREVLGELKLKGAQSFILDLRGNPGGYLTQAIDITSLFVAEGAVVQIEERSGLITKNVTGELATEAPLVLLVNGQSASASELVAAALRDHKRAVIVGEVTYGKGTVQDIHGLSWGGALKYTTAHYMSPDGTVLDGVGVTPDVVVQPATEWVSTALSDHLASDDYLYEEGVDLQLDAALAVLLEELREG